MTPQAFVDNESYRRWVFTQNPDDARYWTDYLNQHPDQRDNADLARTYLITVRGELPALTDEQIQTAVGQLMANTQDGPTFRLPVFDRWRVSPVWAAASVAFLLLTGIAIRQWFVVNRGAQSVTVVKPIPAPPVALTEIVNHRKTPRLVRLSDGSLVVLQPNARLRFPAVFRDSKRDVQLSGTAFFEVVKNPAKPFRVFAGALTTEVLGTSFSINAPATGERVRVIVKTGRVKVSTTTNPLLANATNNGQSSKSHPEDTVLLLPNQQVSFSKADAHLIKSEVVIPKAAGPTIALPAFAFRRTSLPLVLETLEKAYGIPIEFDRNTLATCTLTAQLSEGTLFDKLAIITASTGSSYALQDGRLIIHSAGCH